MSIIINHYHFLQKDLASFCVSYIFRFSVCVTNCVSLSVFKEYFEKSMNEENNREPRTEEAEVVNEEANCVSREEVKNPLKRMKKGKVVGPDELPVEYHGFRTKFGLRPRISDKFFVLSVKY